MLNSVYLDKHAFIYDNLAMLYKLVRLLLKHSLSIVFILLAKLISSNFAFVRLKVSPSVENKVVKNTDIKKALFKNKAFYILKSVAYYERLLLTSRSPIPSESTEIVAGAETEL